MAVNKYNHAGVAFCAYFKCKWPLSAVQAVPWPCLMFQLAGGSVEDTQMTFSECGCCFQCISAVFWLFYSLLVRHQSPELRPVPPHHLNVSPENLFTAMGIMSIITNSSVRLQTGWSFLQSFIEGSCFQALVLHSTSVHSASLQDGNYFLLHISVLYRRSSDYLKK